MRATGNRLLDLLADTLFERLRPHFTAEMVSRTQIVQERGKPVESVIFPTSGIISIVTVMQDGASVEVGLVGCEGMLGIQAVLGDDISFNEAVVSIPGNVLRVSADILRQQAEGNPPFRAILLRYVEAFLNSAMQSAVCNRAHLLEHRLARWLLTARDRVGTDRLRLTHEFISMMLGVRRAGVTVAALSLQKAGLIHYEHGRITIADSEGLEAAACECYEVTKKEYARLLGMPLKSQPRHSEYGDQPRI